MIMNKVHAYARGCLIFFIVVLVLSLPSLSTSGLNLTKSCNARSAYFGDTIVYTFTLENNGTEALSDLVLLDDHLGEIDLNKSALDVGESCAVSVPYKIAEADIPGPLANTARGSAKCEGSDVFSNNASFMVSLGVSGIENLTKFEAVLFNRTNESS